VAVPDQAVKDALLDRRAALADRWRRGIARTSYVPLGAGELREAFLRLVDQAVAGLVDEIDVASVGRQVGSTLVGMGYTTGGALGTTLEILAQDVLAGLPSEHMQSLQPRLVIVLSSIAAGFATAARERLLDEQEESRMAVLVENRRAGESIRRQAALLDLAPDAVLVRGLDGSIAFWNRGAEALYGWSRDEATGSIDYQLLRTKYPRPRAEIEAEVARDGHWEGELIQTRRDGSTITVSSRWAIQMADSAQPQAVLEINTDITIRKQMEATLREREASLEFAQSQAHLGSWESNVLTNETFWSPEAYRLLGYTEGGVQPSLDAYMQAVHPDDLPLVMRAVEATNSGNSYVIEHRTLGRDGVVRVLQAQGNFIADASGQPVRLFGTILDVTERKRAEAERMQLLAEQSARTEAEAAQRRFAFLAEASTRLASSLDYELTLRNVAELAVPTLADACTVDILGENGGVSRVAATRLAAAPEDALERCWSGSTELHPLVTAQRTGESVLYPVLSELSDLVGSDNLTALRSLGIRSLLVAPLVARERVLGVITCFAFESREAYTTIEQALAEELARRCGLAIDNARLHAEAQRATRLRDEFLSVAAHELKTPMTTLRGYAQLLARSMHDGQTPSPTLLQRSVRAIDAQSEKLVTLTEQLLDVSRIEAGKLRLTRRTVDLIELVRGIVQSVQETTVEHAIRLIAPETCFAWVDPMRFEQVVANLVGNSVKYSPNGGGIEVTLREPDPTRIELVVRDWGLGVPPDRRENLFDRFYQAHGEGHFGGLGLGLYVSRQIIELHGGTIEAEFPSSGGSRFVVGLPAIRAASSAGRADVA
jgi:PAS domain S-box-containing protein